MRVLLVKAETEVRHMLAFLLESELGCQVHEAIDCDEAIATLGANPLTFDALICDDKLIFQPLFKHLLEAKFGRRCFLLRASGVAPVLGYPGLVLETIDPTKVSIEVKKLMGPLQPRPKSELVLIDEDDPAYCRIYAELVTRTLPLECDVYLKLSARKYVKVFNRGENIRTKEVSDFLAGKQIEHLYLKKEDSADFMAKLRGKLEELLGSGKTTSKQAAAAAGEVQSAVAELGFKLGFTPEVQEMARQGIALTLKSMGQNPALARLLRGMVQERTKYVAHHSVLVSQIACAIAAAMQWPSGTTFQKLTYAGFFHDMVFRNQELAEIQTMAQLQARLGDFSEAEIQQYRFHPFEVARLVSTFNEVPADVDVVLVQHHERPDGSGFPRGLSAQAIAPLAAVFIIAHDIVSHTNHYGLGGLDEFMAEYRAKNGIGPFKKILAAIDAQGTLAAAGNPDESPGD